TPKEILATEASKFQLPLPIVTSVEKRSSNKFCDFHNDKRHSTNKCMQLKKQIEELVRAGKILHLIKDIKQGREQPKTGKKETAAKDKPTTIYMVRSWQRTVKQKVTQSFERVKEIAFPPLATSNGTEGPLVIEAEMGRHMIHRMYIDGGSLMEILYEDCFNQLRPEIKSQMTPMPNNVKTYDGTGDPEDYVKVFQAAAQVERWAMPTWCHMFNLTLIGAARVWFDELPPESIDGYKDLRAAFLAYFMQQKKYVKDPVEIHNIKQRDGETIEDFMEHFKTETGRMKGAPECMQISGFMHGVNNPELTKRLNEHVPKTLEEMMITTTAFIRGEAAAASKKKGNVSWKPHDQSKRHSSDKNLTFEVTQGKEGGLTGSPPHQNAERNLGYRSK
nr:reverse transcriptase domain-containing protein [Tanacetum cinerariifolium]